MSPSEPEMEHYLRLAGWTQAKNYPQNWSPPGESLSVLRLKLAVEVQRMRDLAEIQTILDRLDVIGAKL